MKTHNSIQGKAHALNKTGALRTIHHQFQIFICFCLYQTIFIPVKFFGEFGLLTYF